MRQCLTSDEVTSIGSATITAEPNLLLKTRKTWIFLFRRQDPVALARGCPHR